MRKRLLSLALALVMALAVVPTATAVDTTYKSWSQGDPHWGSMSMSSTGSGHSMAWEGCYVTAVAKLLVHAGQQDQVNFTPKECLQGLLAHGMLDASGGMYYGRFNDSFLPTYGPDLYKETSDSHGEWGKSTAVSTIGGKIRDGYYVIVCVNNKSTGNTHYMAVDYVSDDIYVMDNGSVVPLYGTWKYSGGVTDQVYFKYNGPYDYPAISNMKPVKTAKIEPGLYTLAPFCAPDRRLEVAGSNKNSQANVQVWNAATSNFQQWSIEAVGDNYYKLVSKDSGLVLDVDGAGTTSGTNVQQYPWTGHTAQQWCFISTEDGYYQIATRLNSDLRLDVNGGADADGANVQIWTKHDGPAQKWKLIPVTSAPNCDNGHTFGEWETVKAASCGVEGQRERVCDLCGEKETETIAALEHDYRVDGETDEAVYYVCANCGDNYTEEKKPSETGKGDFQNFTTQNRYTNGSFGDVKSGDWFYENVKTTYELGLMKGTGSGTFSPGNNVTLAEAITLAARIHSIYYTGSDSFASYDGGNWYDPYVDYARENNIINTYYNYSRPATREEFVHILAKALPEEALENIAGRISFADSGDITYMADVRLLSGAGVINGIKENGQLYFKPLNTITRAEVAAVVGRMAKPSQRVGN